MVCPNYKLRRPGFECMGYRIPNRYEWQYAARGGTATDFYAGALVNADIKYDGVEPSLQRIAWYLGNSDGPTAHPVGLLLPNAWGLYDTLGNVIETQQTPGFNRQVSRWSTLLNRTLLALA